MNRDDIIRMAREAGDVLVDSRGREEFFFDSYGIERFAALVAAAEREECAKLCELVAREIDDTNGTATYIAAAIRARGQS